MQIQIHKYKYTAATTQIPKKIISDGGGNLSPSIQLPATSMFSPFTVHQPQRIQKKTQQHSSRVD